MEKKLLTIEAYNSADCEMPTGIDEFFKWWRNKVDLVPKKYARTTKIKITPYYFHSDEGIQVIISYTREETDEEYSIREADSAARDQMIKRRELKMLAELKSKYEV